ncbi:hypothetical protein LJC00_03410 [Dysgonomonas sp. OttesenSCG-928-M03]|nr:hypothetical protein [Dysgonomonas sp. OttesenSCG-928-M03]
MKRINFVDILLITVCLFSCNLTEKKRDQTILPVTSDLQKDTISSFNDEECDSEEEPVIDKKMYLDIVTEHLKIKQDDYIVEFSDVQILPDKNKSIVLITEYASDEKNTDGDFSIYMRLFILDNNSKKVIGQLKEVILLESSALKITGLSLNLTSYQLLPDFIDFSVEISRETMGRGSPYTEKSAYLFIFMNDEIINILDNYSTYSHSTYWAREDSVVNTEIYTHLAKSAELTNLFPDIIAISDSTFENVLFDVDKDQVITRKNRGKNILKFQNGKYQ